MGSFNPGDCTAATCPVAGGFLNSPPTLEGSAVMLAASAVLVPVHIVLGVRYRTPLYAVMFVLGLLFEVMGYIGRIMLRTDLASRQYFSLSLVGLVMGPTFISGAIYLVLPHVLVLYGRDLSLVSRPLYLGFLFLAFNVFTLAFLAVGCSFAANGKTTGEMTQGVHVLIAGLGIQLGSLILFKVLYYWFVMRITRERHLIEPRHSAIYLSSHFKMFGLCLQIATALILIRTISRIVQFSGGLDSLLVQSEVMTVVLDGALVLIASIILSLAHPGAAFGARAWAETSPERRDDDIDDYGTYGGGEGSAPLHHSRYGGSDAIPSPSSHKMKKSPRQSDQYYQQQQAEDYPPHYKPNIGSTLSGTHTSTPRPVPVYHAPPYEIPPAQQVPFVPPGELSPRSEARSSRSSNRTSGRGQAVATAGAATAGAPGVVVGLPARPKPLQLHPQPAQQQSYKVVDPDSLW